MLTKERIPFIEAVNEPLLFQKQFQRLTPGIQSVLKCVYGLELSADELAYWHAYNGAGKFDELGYLLDAWDSGVPYRAGTEANDITLIVGRRSTKTSGVSSFIVAYEALLGNHGEYVGFKSQSPVFLQVAQDLATAKANLRQFILDIIEQSPVGKHELLKGVVEQGGTRKAPVTAISAKLRNGSLITVGPPSFKLRSQAIPVCAMDEMGVWAKDKESAQPDIEVVRAVSPAMASFPFSKLVKTSTPMTKEGVLWESAQIGTYGHKLENGEAKQAHARTIVIHGPSAALAPAKVLPRERLIAERAKDASAFNREFLAQFADSVTGFLSVDLLRAAVTPGVRQRAPEPGRLYHATLDPAFRRDAFAFAIGHLEGGKYVLDFIEAWRGTTEKPISPTVAMATIATLCEPYKIRLLVTDQYHSENLQERAAEHGLVCNPVYLTQKIKLQMWGEFQGLLNQNKVALLDRQDLLDELSKMEKELTPNGQVRIYGKRDDLAMVVALNVREAMQQGERTPPPPPPVKPLSTQVRERILRRGRDQQPWWA